MGIEILTSLSVADRRPSRNPGRTEPTTLATAEASAGQRWAAALFCAVVLAATLAVVPSASRPMPAFPGFLALNQGALLVVYGVTSWLLFSQVARARCAAMLALAGGMLFTALVVLAQLVAFPDMLGPGLVVGHGPATLTWLWTFWHVGIPAVALPYAIIESRPGPRQMPASRVRAATWGTVVLAVAAALVTAAVCARYAARLPAVADPDGGYRALTRSGIGPLSVALNAVALVVLVAATRLRRVLQLWLAVSLFILMLDNVITDIGAARATMGWFTGRVEALISGLVVLGIYLAEVADLYRQASAAASASEGARREAEAARDSLEIALDASGMGDWQLDLRTDQSRRSLRHDRIFGYGEPQRRWSSARMLDHVVPEDRPIVERAIAGALAGSELRFECRIRRVDDGRVRWIAVQGRTYRDEEGRPATLAGCVADVTERRLTDDRLREAQRMEAIGQLTGGVAHDFNNLLTVILGSLDMISRKPGDAARVERLARNAFAAGRRGTELTEKLLSFSRRQVVNPEVVNLNRILSELEPLLHRAVGEDVEVSLDLDPRLDPVRLDPGQFQAAVLNLAGNARDAMPDGGTLSVSTRNATFGEDDLRDVPEAAPGPHLVVTVADTGTGMDAETAARVFEPFFTTKEIGKGTGLGLSQVYGSARQAGGFCRLRTAPGEGCAVEICLPRSTEAGAEAAPAAAGVPLRRAAGGEVVLVVEDEDALREMAAESLGALGYRVLTACDARAALDVLRGDARIDILFSDVVMPGGMNGAQLAAAAGAIRPGLKVLLTSGYTTTATGGTRELPRGVPLLRKPYLREDLAAKLHTVLGS